MSRKAQWLLVAFGLFLFGSKAHALPLPVSECIRNGNETQTCDLYESDESGNRSKVSSPATSALASMYGADWAPRWVLVYKLTRKNVPAKQPSHVVLVTKPDPSSDGLFADTAILYTSALSRTFKSIRNQALAAPLCNAENTDTSPCLLKIVMDANGVATFQQPYVFNSLNPDSPVEGFDTIEVHSGLAP
jgi:hypothetical protein